MKKIITKLKLADVGQADGDHADGGQAEGEVCQACNCTRSLIR